MVGAMLIAALHLDMPCGMQATAALSLGAGILSGYIAYDCMHYAMHHSAAGTYTQIPVLKRLRRAHMTHHFKQDDGNFGISSPLFDLVFGTKAHAPVQTARTQQLVT